MRLLWALSTNMTKRLTLEETLLEITIKRLSKSEFYSLEKSWLEGFCGEYKAKFGKYIDGGFRWHVFSFGVFPCLENEEAVNAYCLESALEYYVFPESGEGDFVLVLNEKPPVSLLQEYRDFYVFPKNMAWTMAFTHEYGWLGPYFAKNRNYEKLNQKNYMAVEAKNKGWT